MKQKFYYIIIVSILLICIFSCNASKDSLQNGPKMNVLFITVDDLRPNLGCYEDPVAISPNIDKLAEMGVVFNRAYCQQAVCNPSRASVLTGLRPDQCGVTDLKTNFREIVPNVVTLPQIFKNNGYITIDIGKIFHDGKYFHDSISWSSPEVYTPIKKEDQYFLPQNRKGGKASSTEFVDVPDNYYTDGKIADAAIAWINKLKDSKKPFFLALGFKKPHLPFCAPKKYWSLYQDNEFKLNGNQNKPADAPEIAFHHSEELRGYTDIPDTGRITNEKIKQLRRAYYACISFVDAQIGKVMKTLNDLGLAKNTIIILWGDHGYHLGEQALWCKSTNFELDVRIPLIIYAPGVSQKNARTDAIVEALDIYPTLIDLCNVKPVDSLSGISLKPLLMNPDQKWNKVAYSQFIRPYNALFSKLSKKAKYMGYTVRTKDWRCTAWYNLKTDSIDYKELYHMKNNVIEGISIEEINVSGDKKYASIEAKLTQLLNNYKDQSYE